MRREIPRGKFFGCSSYPPANNFAVEYNKRTTLPALVLHELDESGEGVVSDTAEH